MGFRFRNLNPIYRICVTRLSSNTHKFSHPLFQHPSEVVVVVLSSQNPFYFIHRRWHLGYHSHHGDDNSNHNDHGSGLEGEKVFRLGLASDLVLATAKALTGYLSGSTAIIADAAHSVSDVVLSGIALLSFKVAEAPKDKEHPYGHGKFETLGALGISCMLLGTAGGIAWHALDLLQGLISADHQIVDQSLIQDHGHSHSHGGHHHGVDMEHPILALSVTIMSISVKEGLYWITKQAGERKNSGLMIANAWHHRADAISSVVALIGVGEELQHFVLMLFGGSILGMKFLDPLAGLVVSGMILKAGLQTGYQSVMELVDAAIPAKQLDPVKQTILQVEGVQEYAIMFSCVVSWFLQQIVKSLLNSLSQKLYRHIFLRLAGCNHLRGRRAGSSLYVDVNIEVGFSQLLSRLMFYAFYSLTTIAIYVKLAKCSFPAFIWQVDPFYSVSAAHDIGEDVRHQIHKSHPEVAEVFIHIDPATSQISSGDKQESLKRTTCEKSFSVKDNEIEAAISSIISSKFQENMVVEHITRHSLKGKVLLQIEVSMPSNMLIRDAMEVAERAEDEILKADPDIIHVSIQLRLGRPIPQFNNNGKNK
ncbi:Cation efflux protein [Parasponia andersonii]|uniref:Cation efflux protein n=1 Tax=Parasponia andersonii TaxID=3476 RepID=A0A2P5C7V0_PARAD|nr:Cation efflux protein [Parasponia andersonii]